MKRPFAPDTIPNGGLLITCASHEDRCKAIPLAWKQWRPKAVLLIHYVEPNPKRERNHAWLTEAYGRDCEIHDMIFSESVAGESFKANLKSFRTILKRFGRSSIVFDISVFTKRHLFVVLNWLFDFGHDSRLTIVYAEPQDYSVGPLLPLSFGIHTIEQVPGFAAVPDTSRPLHLTVLLGYEGERAHAVYEQLQPIRTTLLVGRPAFRHEWEGRTESFNAKLINKIGAHSTLHIDSLDPEAVRDTLRDLFEREGEIRSDFASVVCPLGTKPQAVGTFLFLREAREPPALLYASPLRHNQSFYSWGIGPVWTIFATQ